MENRTLYIRPHHMLCMQGFQGYGYDSDFAKNMKKIIEIIKKDTNIDIEIIEGCDDICKKCPNNINNVCIDKVKVNKIDSRVMEKLKMHIGTTLKSKEIFQFANDKLKNFPEANYVCGNCSWKKVCLWFKEAINISK
ncbi:DUF1284 domain-containing protein [Haloimpatiens sp. FM7330]|uniref:DUF1284 domain-containing protein n=1 Tax=Haloimpatiens sp. FM7330 TaxID=3298610 RepID=UPI003633BF6C